MAQYSIGRSSYGDLAGVTQYVNAERIAKQFLSMAHDYKLKFGANGDRLTPNEGMRSRPRQQLLYRNYLTYGYPVAATPFSSRHDEVTHGNAIDVGVTQANGTNRALTAEEFAWMHDQAEKRGFTWTGRYFNEPWHIEGATRAEVKAPYSDAVLNGATEPAKPATPAPSTKKRKSMYIEKIIGLGHVLITDHGTYKFDYLTVSGKPVSGTEQINLFQRIFKSDQTDVLKNPNEFNKQEWETIKAVLKKVK